MDGSGTTDRVDRAALSRQWRQEGRYEEIAEFRQQVKEATKKAWKAEGRRWDRDELNEVAWQAAMAKYPPLGVESSEPAKTLSSSHLDEPRTSDGGQVQGLGDLPESWPDLPANASLQAEVAWVQANRHRVMEGEVAHLSRALGPAPSHAALGWLETSVRAYSKWMDIASRAAASTPTESEHVRRERVAIEEMRGLLAEMKPTCPHCGESLM